VHVEHDVGRNRAQLALAVGDSTAVAVDVANVWWQLGFAFAAVEHCHVVAELDQPLHGQRADEPRASDY
jgi:hypothetical protein